MRFVGLSEIFKLTRNRVMSTIASAVWSVQWNLWIHSRGVSTCLTSRQNWLLTLIWIFCRILFRCSCAISPKIFSLFGLMIRPYLPRVLSESVEYRNISCEAKEKYLTWNVYIGPQTGTWVVSWVELGWPYGNVTIYSGKLRFKRSV